ncbi:Hsp20/alpha crystallin family protein [Natrarchaeobius oligotrophus]|uniref:Hsp20/alpha crystallin family protein n=1 Tax=Natrarchaeobius chitinivorans TaxID=1679083 RepID=A0A3N6M4M9_NATCH|nr:Hsp20/alpha crystallin family protein [Natrarchaeobius chitinivorans]
MDDRRYREGDVDDPGKRDESDHWLSSLLSALESLESRSTAGGNRGGRSIFECDLSIGRVGDDRSGFDRRAADADRSDERRSDRTRRTRRRRERSSNAYHLTTRREEGELLVTADVAGADPGDVRVGFDDSTLVVAVAGSELGRTAIPWDDRSADAWIRNGVLTVRVEPSSNRRSTDAEDDDE